jgi:hypothetical protein
MPMEVYRAAKGAQVSAAVSDAAPGPATPLGYTIEVRFMGGLTDRQKGAFTKAADRWTHAIVGDLPDVIDDNGQVINNLVVLAQGAPIDGIGRILGQAGPSLLRPSTAGKAAFLPAKGEMTFDSADLANMEANGTLDDVIAHEMGHVIGIGTIWTNKGLLKGAGTASPTFVGKAAQKEFGALKGNGPTPVPVESHGGPGTRDSHWSDDLFGNELMTGFVAGPPNPLSRMTIASLEDLGYVVNLSAAEKYSLPSAAIVVAEDATVTHLAGEDSMVLRRIPMVLPDENLA